MGSDTSFAKRPAQRLPAEGQDGLYFQTWCPVCLSVELGETDIDYLRAYPRANPEREFINGDGRA